MILKQTKLIFLVSVLIKYGLIIVFSESVHYDMKTSAFRKLHLELPVERVVDDRPWLIGGLVFALALLILVMYAFLRYKGLN